MWTSFAAKFCHFFIDEERFVSAALAVMLAVLTLNLATTPVAAQAAPDRVVVVGRAGTNAATEGERLVFACGNLRYPNVGNGLLVDVAVKNWRAAIPRSPCDQRSRPEICIREAAYVKLDFRVDNGPPHRLDARWNEFAPGGPVVEVNNGLSAEIIDALRNATTVEVSGSSSGSSLPPVVFEMAGFAGKLDGVMQTPACRESAPSPTR